MRTDTAPLIHLTDYSPAPYTVDTVALDVAFAPHDTRIQAELVMRRATGTKPGTPLFLDGDELDLVSFAVDGTPVDDIAVAENGLTLDNPPDSETFHLTIETKLAPAANTKLMGLYQSRGIYCTQCEAEGFRRITFFPDRPDVLATYTVRLEADRSDCPVLLANGNPVETGPLADNRHFAVWHDPHPKPSYLFAMVGGDLDVLEDRITTASGKPVALNIYVEKGKRDMATFAMDALKRSMVWDEQTYGREYDLDVFNIVAVSDFNMGAMENKGLNVFNDKYVLASAQTATDTDTMNIEAIIAHEYFHNWTGNRITCRDWFQLCLKEGLTVYRDQEFSADTRSRAVQRIHQVRVLKSGQFTEDAGPLAHPVRPEAYKEINNFYTATVYQKGAELVRMLATIVGPQAYRTATNLYFERHDGEAAVVEDFVACFRDTADLDMDAFMTWYTQAGTPTVGVSHEYDSKARILTLRFSQTTPATPGQEDKQPVSIPMRFGLLGRDGQELTFSTRDTNVFDDVILLRDREQTVILDDVVAHPVVSLLRGFSAPVTLQMSQSDEDRLLLAAHDSDPYNRWEALYGFATKLLVAGSKAGTDEDWIDTRFVDSLVGATRDDTIDPEFRAQLLTLPTVPEISRAIGKNVDPDAVLASYRALMAALGRGFGASGTDLLNGLKDREQQANDPGAAALRALKNALLTILNAAGGPPARLFAQQQYEQATNMTDRIGALSILLNWQGERELTPRLLADFYERYRDNPLVIDKWFSIQASVQGRDTLQNVVRLSGHQDYTLANPNRARALLGPLAAYNFSALHRSDGAGYDFFTNQVIALDALNPQVAARVLTLMGNWRIFGQAATGKARENLEKISAISKLSRDTREIVDRLIG